MNRVNINSFYQELDLMGYDYSKDFRLHKSRRRSKRNTQITSIEL